MKARHLLFATLPLMLGACGDGGDQAAAQQPGGATGQPAEETRLQKEAREWTKETKELSAAAWDASKEKAGEYAEKSKEYYESAKEKSAEYYEQAKDKSREYYEPAKQEAEADMERRDGHPPDAEAETEPSR